MFDQSLEHLLENSKCKDNAFFQSKEMLSIGRKQTGPKIFQTLVYSRMTKFDGNDRPFKLHDGCISVLGKDGLQQFLLLVIEIHCASTQSRSTPTSGPPKVSARAPAHRSYHFRGVKLKSCIKKIHHNLYISKQANVRIKHADTEGASHKKFGTDARVQ